jgi:hypothetical protein
MTGGEESKHWKKKSQHYVISYVTCCNNAVNDTNSALPKPGLTRIRKFHQKHGQTQILCYIKNILLHSRSDQQYAQIRTTALFYVIWYTTKLICIFM